MASAAKMIEDEILVLMADVNTDIASKFGMLAGLDFNIDNDFPSIRILDPNPGKTSVIKYVYN
jgi:hypothetical protein